MNPIAETGYVTDLLAYPREFWNQGHLWPRSDRKHVFLADAFLAVGRAMFGRDVWTGREPDEAKDYHAGEVELALAGATELARLTRLRRVVQSRARMPTPDTRTVIHASSSYFDAHVCAYIMEEQRRDRIEGALAAKTQPIKGKRLDRSRRTDRGIRHLRAPSQRHLAIPAAVRRMARGARMGALASHLQLGDEWRDRIRICGKARVRAGPSKLPI